MTQLQQFLLCIELRYPVNLVAFLLKTLFILFGLRSQHSQQFTASHMTFRRMKSWYLLFIIINQEGFPLPNCQIYPKTDCEKQKFQELRSSWKFITMEKPFSTPTLQRKIIFYLLTTELCQLVKPFYCSTLDCFPCWVLILEKIHHWKKKHEKNYLSLMFREYICIGQ